MKNPGRLLRALCAVATGTTATAATLLALAGPSAVQAAPLAVRLVSGSGTDAGDCTVAACRSIQYAVSKALANDTISVAAGTYTGTIVVDDTTPNLKLLGANPATTIVDGGGNIRIFNIETSVVISGFTIQNGKSNGGSGILANVATDFAATKPISIVNNIIKTNSAVVEAPGDFPVGSAIKVDGAMVYVANNTIQGNTQSAIRINDSVGATFANNIITGNSNTGDTGGAMWIDGNSVITLTANTFTNNSAEYGGAIAITKLTNQGNIAGNTFQGNSAVEMGAAIYVNEVANTLTISGNQIMTNTAGRGAGIGSMGISTFTIANNEIAYNTINGTGASGGGIHFEATAGGTIKGNQIHHNSAPSGYGGGIDIDDGGPTLLENNIIYNNTVLNTAAGGGVRITGSGPTQLIGNQIYNHTTNGLFVANGASAVISGNQVLTNSALTDGGGVRIVGMASFTFANNTVSNNSVYFLAQPSLPKGFGGGLHVISSTGVIEQNTFTGNKSGDYDGGGAVGITERSTVIVRNNNFNANRAEFGSAVAILNPTGGSTTIDSNLMLNNRQNAPGGVEDGVVEIRGAVSHPVTVVNNLLANNSLITFTQQAVPNIGTGVRCGEGTTGPVIIANNTFYKNGDRAMSIAGTDEGAACSASVSVFNNILADHSTAGIKFGAGSTAVLTTTYNIFSTSTDALGSIAGPGNLTANPQFTSTATNDFRLKAGSPAIDTGTNTGAPSKDLLGTARPFGAKADIGAYEFTTAISQSIVLNLPATKLTTDVPFTVSATYSSTGAATFGAGPSSVCTIAGNTITLVASGACVVTATAPADGNYFTATTSGTITVNKAAQIVTLGALAAKLTTDAPFTVSATYSATGAATYAAGPASVCTNSGNTITLVAAGTCTITATAPSDVKYLAGSATGSFAISKAAQTITFDLLPNRLVTDSGFTVVATATSGLVVEFTASGVCSVTLTGDVTLSGSSGTCIITASQSGNGVYLPATNVPRSFSVSDPGKQNQSINFAALPNTITVSSTLNLSATATSGLQVGFASQTPAVCTVANDVATAIAAGLCTIEAIQGGDNQFNPAPAVTQTVEVVAAPPAEGITTTITTGAGGELVYIDPNGGSVTVQAPAGAVTGSVEIKYVDQVSPTAPYSGVFAFAGHTFTLSAYRDGVLVDGFTFQQPVSVVIEYTDADVAGLDESALTLFYHDGAAQQWAQTGITLVSHDLVNNRITFTVTHFTSFALGEAHRLYLPLMAK